ncbi:hypothetical protein M408DRAFT_137747 [Serendipita vermifera MAFF 305830]|uniref:Uncharacterized protein n=1 Tax=Serendipita vermifera MAFF 305830 TaxID=933852 RepID=A0A0C3BB50_SERVB|nr:hypothetical protein M408DRAFT_137747 [Serendipita vermifera MAFF 305830]
MAKQRHLSEEMADLCSASSCSLLTNSSCVESLGYVLVITSTTDIVHVPKVASSRPLTKARLAVSHFSNERKLLLSSI